MVSKKNLGILIMLILSIIPILLLLLLGPKKDFLNYKEASHFIGQISGLLSLTFFAITFILSSRFKFVENLFGGLDKVYKVHAVTGALTLIFALVHPIFLVLKFIPDNLGLASKYLLPGGLISVDFGMISLYGMMILIIVTLYMKIKYNYWKISHKFLTISFIFAVVHIFLIRDNGAKDYIFRGYYIYAVIISVMGFFGMIYSLFLKGINKTYKYRLSSLNVYNGNIFDMYFTPIKKHIKYYGGQFVFLNIKNKKLGFEQHPFSIASGRSDKEIRIMAKTLGDWTSKLAYLKKGDIAYIEGSYGKFPYQGKNNDQIWIAGGIGVTPFIGMARDYNGDKNITLYYSVIKEEDFVSLDFFEHLSYISGGRFKIIKWVTRNKGYIDANIVSSGEFHKKDYFICGPQAMKESITEGLIKKGIDKENIHMEEFSMK